MQKIILGLTEKVKIKGKKSSKTVVARIDSGATKSSMDAKLVAELELGPVVGTRLVKSAHGNTLRAVIKADVNLHGKQMKKDFTIADRAHMKYRVLIGQNILKKGFLIDPSK